MGVSVSENGVIVVKDGIKRLDTRDKLLHGNTWGFPISGTQSISAVTGGGDGDPGRRNLTTVYDLGPAPDGHDTVYGVCKFDLNNDTAGLAFNRYHVVMGGSILWVMDGEIANTSFIGDNSILGQWVDYHFRVLDGRVELVRRLFIWDSQGTYTVLSHDITYKLRTGVWT
jgi:hypothetical protein